jgi:hypothetical protein
VSRERYGQGVENGWSAHAERHRALCAKWGKPEAVSVAVAMQALGVTGMPDPDEVIAFRYASRGAAEAFAASNLEHHGYRSLGIAVTDAGVIGAVHVPADA